VKGSQVADVYTRPLEPKRIGKGIIEREVGIGLTRWAALSCTSLLYHFDVTCSVFIAFSWGAFHAASYPLKQNFVYEVVMVEFNQVPGRSNPQAHARSSSCWLAYSK